MEPLTEDDLKSIVLSEISNSIGYLSGSEIVTERELNLDYYLTRPTGDEREGFSQVQDSTVYDTIESMLPSLVKIFTSGDEIVSFAPMQQADEQTAKQQTDGVNYVVTKENPWFQICYTWLKDGLIQKNGIVKTYWEDDPKITTESYTGLTDIEVQYLLSPEGPDEIEVTGRDSYNMENGLPAQAPSPDQNDPLGLLAPGILHDIEIKRTEKRGKVHIQNIPPEHFIISRGATCIATARFTGHKERKTISDLRSMGISEEKLENISGSTEISSSDEEYARWQDQDSMRDLSNSSPLDESMREVDLVEGYVRADMDGDGIAELHRVLVAGRDILLSEKWDENPFESFTPIPLPHQFFGRAIADISRPTQDIKRTIKRSMLDNFYQMNNGGFIYDRNAQVDLDALINRVPGFCVGANSTSAVVPMDARALPNTAYDLMELETSANEARTGQTRYNQGLDADSLNKTATGASIIQSAAQQRLELIARIFAETSVVPLFKKVAELMIKHQDKAKMVRLRDKWVEVDPRSWNAEMDATINVGLSTSSKEMDVQRYMNALAVAEKVFPLGIIKPDGISKLVSRLFEAAGIKSPEEIVVDMTQPQQPKPDPMQQQMQVEQQKMQAEMQMTQMKTQADIQSSQAKTQADIENSRMKAQSDIAIKHESAQADIALKAEMQRVAAFGGNGFAPV